MIFFSHFFNGSSDFEININDLDQLFSEYERKIGHAQFKCGKVAIVIISVKKSKEMKIVEWNYFQFW